MLAFLRRHDIVDVPEPVWKADPGFGAALYGWIDGTPVRVPGRAEIDAMVGFLERLQVLRATGGAATLPLAASACLSALVAVEQADAPVWNT